jgi:hypothetical protein
MVTPCRWFVGDAVAACFVAGADPESRVPVRATASAGEGP